MNSRELHQAVARATGESVAEIRRRGFSLLDPDPFDLDPLPSEGQVIDWDLYDLERNVPLVDQPHAALVSVA